MTALPPPPFVADAAGARRVDPDLESGPGSGPAHLLAIDWRTVPLATDADARAVWKTIAPTGADWELKLDEVPVTSARPLAIALLHDGNFQCVAPQHPVLDCVRLVLDVEPPGQTAGLDDPCLRRLLGLWAISALESDDIPTVIDSLRQIAKIPPPESQLVAAAIQAVPETDQDRRLELIAIAHHAGQAELADGMLGSFDEAHLIEAVLKHHIDGAIEVLSAEAHRAVYLAAIKDEAIGGKARAIAITELVAGTDRATPETTAALVAATKSKDCGVAATAARALETHGDKRFLPTRPHTSSAEKMMRALCVLASYERLQNNDEASRLAGFVPAKGLERVQIAFDPLGEVDADGDGDPRTERTVDLVPRTEIVVPEIDDMIRAFRHCTGTSCSSGDREFRFVFQPAAGELWLSRIELAERPSCPR